MAQRRFEGLSPEDELDIKDRAMDEAPVGVTLSDPSREDNPLVYVNEAFEEVTGYGADEVIGRNCRFLQGPETDEEPRAAMRRAIDAREPVRVEILNYRKDGEPFWNEVTIAPVRDEEGDLSHFVGFQKDVTARVEAERALERERERLDDLVDRIEGFVADVTADVIRADSRSAVHDVLCDRIVATDPYSSACVLRTNLDGGFEVAALCGETAAPADGPFRVGEDATLAVALASRDARTVDADVWRSEIPGGGDLIADDAEIVAVVPIVYGDVEYGVLVIGSADGLDERETVVLRSLASTAATAINALERGRMLTGSSAIEVTFAIPEPDLPLAALAATTGATLTVLESVSRGDGVSMVVGSDTRMDDLEDLPTGLTVRRLKDGDDGTVLDVRLDETWIFDDVADRAGEVVGLQVTADGAELVVRGPHRDAVRAVRDYVVDRYPGASLRGTTEVERSPARPEDQGLLGDLTDKQREALQKAYYGGYFDRPRAVTGDDLAETMDISRATFNQHLRTAERKLLGNAFGGRTTD